MTYAFTNAMVYAPKILQNVLENKLVSKFRIQGIIQKLLLFGKKKLDYTHIQPKMRCSLFDLFVDGKWKLFMQVLPFFFRLPIL